MSTEVQPEGQRNGHEVGLDGGLSDALVRTRRFFTKGTVSEDLRTLTKKGGRQADDFYRDRWSHDKVVRSTHGVNCTGSCSWKVYVKDGIITWETQQTDYPSVGPDKPEYEPRGCPRGAAFSWYTYSPDPGPLPLRPRRAAADVPRGQVPARRRPGQGLGAHRRQPAAREGLQVRPRQGRPGPRDLGRGHRDGRGRLRRTRSRSGGRTGSPASRRSRRCRWSRTPRAPGSPRWSAARCCRFYDWYADLPVASPQVFGDQTDVPESGDWWDAGYLVMWGSNVPVTRTPDAHWMTEARYRGQKVVVVSPDYADNVKFADEWLAIAPGTDGALAMAMGHVDPQGVLRRPADAVLHRLHEEVHRPALPRRPRGRSRTAGTYRAGKFLTAADLPEHAAEENAHFKTVLVDARTDELVGAQRLARATGSATPASAGGTSTSATSTRD